MRGTVYPRPARRVVDERTGRERLAPLRAREEWTDPRTGKVVKAGPAGSSWSWSFTTGTRAGGNRRTHSKGGYPTRKAAQAALTEALSAYGKGDKRPLQKAEATPLCEYLTTWLETREGLRPSTRRGYQNVVDGWVRPHIGKVPLRDLGPGDLTGLYSTLRESGARRDKAARATVDPAGAHGVADGASRRGRGRPDRLQPGRADSAAAAAEAPGREAGRQVLVA